MNAQTPERSNSFSVIQVLGPNRQRLAAFFGDAGPMVGGRPVFDSYLFTPARRFERWMLERPGVVGVLNGEVSRHELETVRSFAETAAARAARNLGRRTVLGEVGAVVQIMGRDFKLEMKRDRVIAVPVH